MISIHQKLKENKELNLEVFFITKKIRLILRNIIWKFSTYDKNGGEGWFKALQIRMKAINKQQSNWEGVDTANRRATFIKEGVNQLLGNKKLFEEAIRLIDQGDELLLQNWLILTLDVFGAHKKITDVHGVEKAVSDLTENSFLQDMEEDSLTFPADKIETVIVPKIFDAEYLKRNPKVHQDRIKEVLKYVWLQSKKNDMGTGSGATAGMGIDGSINHAPMSIITQYIYEEDPYVGMEFGFGSGNAALAMIENTNYYLYCVEVIIYINFMFVFDFIYLCLLFIDK